ncbi:MAG: periplasmic heavy metal sensor [Deltaproteobacteria bacterium]|nr:periplasmic heavy metal sensor [Deltaproteobacteria bacterium]
MFGFLIGTACLIGLIATLRRGSRCGGWAYSGGCGHRGPWGHDGGHGWGHHRHGWGQGHGCGHHHPHHPHHPQGGWWEDDERGGSDEPPFRRGFRGFGWLGMISERLDLTPAQEKVVRQAFAEVRDVVRKQRGEIGQTRKDVARAVRAQSFDAVLLGDLFGRHDDGISEVRKAIVGALARVHEALDEQQREKLASMLEGGFAEGWW